MHKQLLSLLCFLAGTSATPCNTSFPVLKAALICAPPALRPEFILSREYRGVDIKATTILGVNYIERAARALNSLRFLNYGFQRQLPSRHQPTWTKKWGKAIVENSTTRGDSNWNRLVAAAKRNAVYIELGYPERQGDYISMAQTLINPKGEVLIHRHKLRPSGWREIFGVMTR